MKKQNKNIQEPYDPQKTPKPPQIIDPENAQKKENPIERKERDEASKTATASPNRQHLLSEDAEIDDETTV